MKTTEKNAQKTYAIDLVKRMAKNQKEISNLSNIDKLAYLEQTYGVPSEGTKLQSKQQTTFAGLTMREQLEYLKKQLKTGGKMPSDETAVERINLVAYDKASVRGRIAYLMEKHDVKIDDVVHVGLERLQALFALFTSYSTFDDLQDDLLHVSVSGTDDVTDDVDDTDDVTDDVEAA